MGFALSLQTMERVWLKGRPFVAGSEISIADLLYASELDMLRTLETVPEVAALACITSACMAWVPFTLVSLASAKYRKGAFAAGSCASCEGTPAPNPVLSVQPWAVKHGCVSLAHHYCLI